MTYGHLQADCLYTGISSGPIARYRVWEAFTFFYLLTDSLAGFGGDVSASSDDESGIARTQSITSLDESDSWPRSRRGHAEVSERGKQPAGGAAVTSSLPDLVTSSEIGRRSGGLSGSFIGGVRDIDSLLGFGETEDEMEVRSDEEEDSNDATNSDASFATSHERQDRRDDRSTDRSFFQDITYSTLFTVYTAAIENKKGKGFPHSTPSVGPGADPGVQAVSLQVTVKSSTRR